MTEFARNPQTGEVLRRDALSSQWVPATQADVDAAREGALAAFGGTIRDEAEAFFDLAAMGVSFGVPNQQAGRAARSEFASRLGDLEERRGARSRESPLAQGLGVAATFGAPFAGAAARGIARKGGQEIVERVQQKVSRDLGDVIRGPDPGPVRSAAGAAGDQITAIAEAVPILRGFARLPAERRARQMGRMAWTGAGATARDFGKGGIVRTRSANRIVRETENMFEEAVDADALIDVGQELARTRALVKTLPKAERELFGENLSKGVLTGKQFKSWRQEMSKMSAKDSNEVRRNLARQLVDGLDKVALKSDAINHELWKEARGRWRWWLALNKGQAWKGGNVKPTTLANNMKSIFGNEFTLGRGTGQTGELLTGIRQAQELGTQIPSSGTGERIIGAALLGEATGLTDIF